MGQDLLKALAQFRILFKKELGVPADLEKMLSDPAYGRLVLAQAEDSGNETLVMLAPIPARPAGTIERMA